jgi:hypothetical protein
MTSPDLTFDHHDLADSVATRRYFRKFARLCGHLAAVAAEEQAQGRMTPQEVEALGRGLVALTLTFRALAWKYHFAGLAREAGRLTFDRVESGFPVAAEIMEMAADATQAERHLQGMPTAEEIKDRMVRHILSERTTPLRLQFALSQRLYHEELTKGGLFWARNDPEAEWIGTEAAGTRAERRRYLLRWSVYDAQENLPVLYLMTVSDTGRTSLPKDADRWPLVQRHLMAQSVGGLTLLTIARGFDQDFPDLHPKRLRRIRIGPMWSHAFTAQTGPIREVLETARAPEGEDWALAWTEELLLSERAEMIRSGWFGTHEREVFTLMEPREQGATEITRSLILPARPYQALAALDPPAFRAHRKFVVGEGGRVLMFQ